MNPQDLPPTPAYHEYPDGVHMPDDSLPPEAGTSYRPLLSDLQSVVDCKEPKFPQSEAETMSGVPIMSARANRASLDAARRDNADAMRTAFPLRRLLGRGGYGEVWEATQTSLGRQVAVKQLRPDVLEQAIQKGDTVVATLERAFENEALTASMLEHPNIVPVYDLSQDGDGPPRLAMKLVRGRTWHESIQEDFDQQIPVTEFLAHHIPILISISQAVAFAHSRGIVHRDLKPSQVMLGEFGEALLMDWGIAAVFDADLASKSMAGFTTDQMLSSMSGPAGTPAYMAPEQTERDQANVGPWTDIYLLGGILYQLLCGRAPHGAETGKLAFKQACEGLVEPPSSHLEPHRDVPAELESLAMQCLAVDPGLRPRTVKLFIRRLEEYLFGAGRRREAEEIREEILRRLPQVGSDYGELARLDSLAAKARALWPESVHITGTHEVILSRFARAALEQGDLKLARVQADRITDPVDKVALEKEIHRIETRMAGARRQHRAAVLAVLGMALILLAGGARATWERLLAAQERSLSDFERAADQAVVATSRAISQQTDNLYGVASFMGALPDASRGDFRRFVTPYLDRHPGIQSVLWVPQVSTNDRSRFEQLLRYDGFPGATIRESVIGGATAKASERRLHYPVRFAEPAALSSPIVGFDFLSLEETSGALNRARETGRPALSRRLELNGDVERGTGVIMAVPTYAVRNDSADGSTSVSQPFLGFAVGVWNVKALLQTALQGQIHPDFHVDLYDTGAFGNSSPLADWGSNIRSDDLASALRYRAPIMVGGRRWTVEVTGRPLVGAEKPMAIVFEVLWPMVSVMVIVAAVYFSRWRLRSVLRRRA